MQARQITETRLFGRQREQEMLRAELERVLSGEGRLVLVDGEAGIGKTALVQDLAREAAERGCIVLVGRCYDLTTTPPYGPWIEVVRASPRVEGLSSLSAILSSDVSEPAGVSRGRDELLGWALELFEKLAEQQPVVVLLDDLHWADEASLEALRLLARQMSQLRVLLIGTYRSDEITRHHSLYTLVPVLVREAAAERIALRPLTGHDVRLWLSEQYALEPPDEQRLAEYLEHYADGNPFFIIELLRALEDDRTLVPTGDRFRLGQLTSAAVPQLLKQVIDRRLDRFDEETRDLLAIASVIGQRIDLDVWRQVVEADALRIERALADGFEAQILVSDGHDAGVAFRHALIREALYQDILSPRRQVWHRRIAEALLLTPSPDPDQVAHHFRQAGDPRAVEWLTRAGDRAYREAYALHTAAARFEEALELIGTRNEALQQRGWLLIRLALVSRLDNPRRSILLLNDTVEIARRVGDRALEAVTLWNRGVVRTYVGEYALVDMETGHRMIKALDDLEFQRLRREIPNRTNNPQFQEAVLVSWYAGFGQYRESLELAERAEANAPESGTPYDGYIYHGRGLAYSALGRPAEARAAFERSIQIYRDHGFDYHAHTGISFLLFETALVYYTDDVPWRERLADTLRTYAAKGLRQIVSHSYRQMLLLLFLLDGTWDEIEQASAEANATRQKSLFHWMYGLPVYAMHAAYTGNRDGAWDHLRTLLPDGYETDFAHAGWYSRDMEVLQLAANLSLDEGNIDGAREWIAAHERWSEWAGHIPQRARTEVLWSRYFLTTGDVGRARQHAEAAIERASDPRQPQTLILALRFLGQIAHREGRADDACQHLTASLELAEQCAMPFEQARTLVALAEVEIALDQHAEARSRLEQSRRIAQRLRAQPLLDEIARLSDQLPLRRAPNTLSEREMDVLRLVSEGLTDREVADRLFISPRTVNQHLRSIYNKLGVGSRAAATRVAIERELL